MIPMTPAEIDANPGRWCDVCKSHGWHHTDRHDEFVAADEPRRVEADAAFIDIDDDPNPWINEHGTDLTPGQAPSTGRWI